MFGWLRRDLPLGIAVATCGVLVAGILAGAGSPFARAIACWVTAAILQVAMCGYAAAAARRLHHRSAARRFWIGYAAAGLVYAVGSAAQLTGALADPAGAATENPVKVTCVAAGTAIVLVVILGYPLGLGSPGERIRLWLDFGAVAAAAAALGVFWAGSMGAGSLGTGSVLTIAAGPIPVLVTVFAVAKLLLTGRPPFSWPTAALGAAAGLVDGVARAIMPLPGVIQDPRWLLAATLVAHLLLTASARVQHRQLAASPSSIRESGRHQSYSALPYCAIAVTCALLGIAIATGGNGPRTWALFGSAILSVLFVVFRQLSALAGNAHQLAELDLRLRELTRVVAAGEGFHPAPADRLTGLASRAEFAVRLQEAWDGACETRSRIGIMLVDLDRFTALTSQLGDRTGDVILQQASTRLGTCLRTGDLAARLGADRFAVLLSGPTLGHLQHVARRVVAALAEPYAIGTEQVRITASVGIAVERGDRTDPSRLLRDADEAVYAAKSRYSTRSGGAEIYA